MPTLDWIGKKAVVNHHREVPYRLIHCDKKKSWRSRCRQSFGAGRQFGGSGLLPYYAGKVKCIYIDPPYNTGNEAWVYTTASTHLKSRRGSARLRLLKEFLADDGCIVISIDDVEFPSLRLDVMQRRNSASFSAQPDRAVTGKFIRKGR